MHLAPVVVQQIPDSACYKPVSGKRQKENVSDLFGLHCECAFFDVNLWNKAEYTSHCQLAIHRTEKKSF